MADSFLVLVPHKTLHGTISILIQRPKLATNVGKMGAVKNKMPFIPQCPGPAQSAAAEMPGDGRLPWGHKKLLKDDLNGAAALDTAGTAKEGVLQRLEVPKRDNGCISWGPDFTTVRGTRLQDGLLQPG